MNEKNITKFPKGFFQLERPTITASEALKDAIPIEWKEETEEKNSKKKKVQLENQKK